MVTMSAGLFKAYIKRGGWYARIWVHVFERPIQHIVEQRLDCVIYHLKKTRVKDNSGWIAVFEQHLLFVSKVHTIARILGRFAKCVSAQLLRYLANYR